MDKELIKCIKNSKRLMTLNTGTRADGDVSTSHASIAFGKKSRSIDNWNSVNDRDG